MENIGIDLGSRTSHICVVDSETNERTLERSVRTEDLEHWLAKRPTARVIMETCTEAFAVAERAVENGHEVRVVPSSLVRQLGVGRRGIKNDRRDAQVLAEASARNGDSLPFVHVPSSRSRQLRRALAARSSLVATRAKLVVTVKSLLRQELIVLAGGTPKGFSKRVRRVIESPERLAIIGPILQSIDAISASIEECNATVALLSDDYPAIKLLKTVPGIGPVIAAMIVAVVDNHERFDKGANLASYAGLTPGENTTGGKRRLTGITRAGQGQLRTMLIQACWTLIRTMPECALAQRYAKLAKQKPKQVAIVATARKLCVVIHAMLRKRCGFNPTLGAKTVIEAPSAAEQLAEALR